MGGGWWWWWVCKPILVFSFDFSQAEQQNIEGNEARESIHLEDASHQTVTEQPSINEHHELTYDDQCASLRLGRRRRFS